MPKQLGDIAWPVSTARLSLRRARGRDRDRPSGRPGVYTGAALIRYYARLTVLGGLAAIVGPIIGGQLARVTDWRGLFIFLAAVGVALLLASALIFGETPAGRPTHSRRPASRRRRIPHTSS